MKLHQPVFDFKIVFKKDQLSSVYNVLRELLITAKNKTSKYSELERKVLAKGYKLDDLQTCLNEYTKLNILYISSNKSEITLL